MESSYQKIIDYMLVSGKRLVGQAGKIKDIGVAKQYLTEEDIAIERGFKEIIEGFGADHVLYAEEENDMFQEAESVWVVDPISGTATFIAGLPHYAIVISHLVKGKAVFSAIYDPSVDEMFTAYKGKGAFLNGQKISVSTNQENLMIFDSKDRGNPKAAAALSDSMAGYKIERPSFSVGVSCSRIARGQADGLTLFSKDSFPEFAGGLLIREAGGSFSNIHGESDIQASDRVFIGGNEEFYRKLFPLVQEAVSK